MEAQIKFSTRLLPEVESQCAFAHLVEYASTVGLAGWSWTECLMEPSDGVYALGIDLAGLLTSARMLSLNQVGYHQVLAMLKVADYLLIAKPVASNQSGIRCDCAKLL